MNPEYFEKIGQSLEEIAEQEEASALEEKAEAPKITVDHESEYFKWKKGLRKRG